MSAWLWLKEVRKTKIKKKPPQCCNIIPNLDISNTQSIIPYVNYSIGNIIPNWSFGLLLWVVLHIIGCCINCSFFGTMVQGIYLTSKRKGHFLIKFFQTKKFIQTRQGSLNLADPEHRTTDRVDSGTLIILSKPLFLYIWPGCTHWVLWTTMYHFGTLDHKVMFVYLRPLD